MSKVKSYYSLEDWWHEKNERYTPRVYVDAARRVMGRINVDPASCEFANQVVRADRYYTIQNSGLAHIWRGNVWINPPFIGDLGAWMNTLVDQYRDGYVTQAIALIPVAGGVFSTRWFRRLLDFAVCIPGHRIRYYDGNRQLDQPKFTSIFFYLGENERRFYNEFSKFGPILKMVE